MKKKTCEYCLVKPAKIKYCKSCSILVRKLQQQKAKDKYEKKRKQQRRLISKDKSWYSFTCRNPLCRKTQTIKLNYTPRRRKVWNKKYKYWQWIKKKQTRKRKYCDNECRYNFYKLRFHLKMELIDWGDIPVLLVENGEETIIPELLSIKGLYEW